MTRILKIELQEAEDLYQQRLIQIENTKVLEKAIRIVAGVMKMRSVPVDLFEKLKGDVTFEISHQELVVKGILPTGPTHLKIQLWGHEPKRLFIEIDCTKVFVVSFELESNNQIKDVVIDMFHPGAWEEWFNVDSIIAKFQASIDDERRRDDEFRIFEGLSTGLSTEIIQRYNQLGIYF